MEEKTHVQLNPSTIFKRIEDELVVVQLQTGEVFYFNSDSEPVFEALKEPKTLREDPLRAFGEFLKENQIAQEVQASPSDFQLDEGKQPEFLRRGEKKLDELTFLCP